jgi:hypothetical protein
MNPSGLPGEIRVKRARDDSLVIRTLPVQPEEVPAIERQYDALLGTCESQDLRIGHPLPGAPQVCHRYHVMDVGTQSLHHRQWEVLVGQQPCHRLRCLILGDLALDLLPVAVYVGPGVR